MTSPQYDPARQMPPGADPNAPPYPDYAPYPPVAGYPAPSTYPVSGGYYPPVPAVVMPYRRTNTMAILSLVFAFVFSPLAIVFGHMARKQIRMTGEDGDGLALAGMIIGYVSVGIALLVLAFLIPFVAIASHGVGAGS